MNKDLLKNNYLFVDEFVSKEQAKLLGDDFLINAKLYPQKFNLSDGQVSNSASKYNHLPLLQLLCEKTKHVSEIIGDKVLPTYCYARAYKKGNVLAPHTDRPACEISVTLTLLSDGAEWPIYFKDSNGETHSVMTKEGQAAVYLGCVAEHWREEFAGDELVQVFLHYVRVDGPYSNFYFDRKTNE